MELWKTKMKEERKKEKEQKERKLKKNLFGKNNNKKPFIKCLVSSKYHAKIFERIMKNELF